MTERAAKPILEFAQAYRADTVGDDSANVARSALLVALDPEDEKLVEAVARGVHAENRTTPFEDLWEGAMQCALADARAAIAALRALNAD